MFEGGEAADEGGFSGAGLSDDAMDGAAVDVERDIVEGDDFVAALDGVHLTDSVQVDHDALRVVS